MTLTEELAKVRGFLRELCGGLPRNELPQPIMDWWDTEQGIIAAELNERERTRTAALEAIDAQIKNLQEKRDAIAGTKKPDERGGSQP